MFFRELTRPETGRGKQGRVLRQVYNRAGAHSRAGAQLH